MTTETSTFDTTPPPEVLEDLRDLLAEALRTQAAISAHTSMHLEELGDADAAGGEMGVALLASWLADNVSAWTHTTRLREGLMKFDPIAAGAALGEVIAKDHSVVDVTVRTPAAPADDCDGDSTVCHACHTEHPGGVGGAWCPAAGDARPASPPVSPDELDEDEEGPQ